MVIHVIDINKYHNSICINLFMIYWCYSEVFGEKRMMTNCFFLIYTSSIVKVKSNFLLLWFQLLPNSPSLVQQRRPSKKLWQTIWGLLQTGRVVVAEKRTPPNGSLGLRRLYSELGSVWLLDDNPTHIGCSTAIDFIYSFKLFRVVCTWGGTRLLWQF